MRRLLSDRSGSAGCDEAEKAELCLACLATGHCRTDGRMTRTYLTDMGREIERQKGFIRDAHINQIFSGMCPLAGELGGGSAQHRT